jgi:hypothetical protein
VVAGARLDPDRSDELLDQEWFEAEQARVHHQVNRVWPRRLGTTPAGMARALTTRGRGVRYRWRLFRGRRDRLSDVQCAVEAGRPVAMVIGRFIPRHWVLIVEVAGRLWQCYEPSSGGVHTVSVDAVRRSRLSALGYPRPFAFVLPRASTRSATN